MCYFNAMESIGNKYGGTKSADAIKFDETIPSKKYTEEFFDNEDLNAKNHVDVMFIHSNFPKFDPYDLSKSNFLTTNGKPARYIRP
ncbi:CGH_1_HP_G0084120.mRNA.1.CDS.1 [Saccharomyces cerevisiae]|nr:CGH_1_HP_G0084120.mRNA.1.CDS.1 [Saccharomyces cerevisiae]CAI6928587.1 CGH_1_HP_G0084120.mRNA.1.CDS.1 [Saccharomyces cerevisiae]